MLAHWTQKVALPTGSAPNVRELVNMSIRLTLSGSEVRIRRNTAV